MSILPSEAPLQLIFVSNFTIDKASGCVIINDYSIVQPLASVTTTLYVPGPKPL